MTYPASGDAILGADIGPKATGIWKYQASVALTPAQIAVLSDPSQVQSIRNVVHFEVAPRNSQAAQPYDDDPQFGNPLQSRASAAAAANVVLTVTTPDGAKIPVTSSTVPGLASLAPGASASYSTSYLVPAVAGKAGGESDTDYLKRLGGIDSSKLNATASATGTGLSGQVSASAGPVTTTEHLPIVGITKTLWPMTAPVSSSARPPPGAVRRWREWPTVTTPPAGGPHSQTSRASPRSPTTPAVS